MIYYSPAVEQLIEEFTKLPGIGPKTAQRLTFHLLKTSKEQALSLVGAISEVKDKIRFCARCFNLTESELCQFCLDATRDKQLVCVVEEASDVVAVEKTGWFKGTYHVLQGAMSPMEGIGPDEIRVNELIARAEQDAVREVIVATNPNIEGEATAMYLAKILKPLGIKVTRLASGLPVGGDLEYADEITLGRALEGRREL